ncbi:hypothetical protein LKV13_03960 [Borrelia sp. BU AG58]|uniref:hypothetical protein n=1 Tax=Borrelia sp. BU AG58 TaxID=2887345 RepID=UPI001E582ED5|nr:hypothetical protein [Borrelia sp. BU AG58]UER67916.1 hypothetical protein LKV13_03960 [Borrelia sp. BU AG58]
MRTYVSKIVFVYFFTANLAQAAVPYGTCFEISPSSVYFLSRGYSKICSGSNASQVYVGSRVKQKQIISAMISHITKNLKNKNIYILQFSFDESEIRIENRFSINAKFRVIKSKSYKNIPIQKTLVYYAKKFEDYKRHNKINLYIDIIEPIVFAKKNLKAGKYLNEDNVYFKYKVNTARPNEFLSLNELNRARYVVLYETNKHDGIKLDKIQKQK